MLLQVLVYVCTKRFWTRVCVLLGDERRAVHERFTAMPTDASHQEYKRVQGVHVVPPHHFCPVWVASTQREEQTNWMCRGGAVCWVYAAVQHLWVLL
jgi:hypothetical protein